MGTPQAGYTDAATGHLDGSAYGHGYAAPGQPAVPDPGWYSSDTSNGNGTSYYDPGYAAAANSDPDYTGNSYTGADYYGSYGDSAYQGGYPAPPAANGYPTGAIQGGHPDPASYQANGQFAGHHDQRAIGAPDLAYGHDGQQGYPGYGGDGR